MLKVTDSPEEVLRKRDVEGEEEIARGCPFSLGLSALVFFISNIPFWSFLRSSTLLLALPRRSARPLLFPQELLRYQSWVFSSPSLAIPTSLPYWSLVLMLVSSHWVSVL